MAQIWAEIIFSLLMSSGVHSHFLVFILFYEGTTLWRWQPSYGNLIIPFLLHIIYGNFYMNIRSMYVAILVFLKHAGYIIKVLRLCKLQDSLTHFSPVSHCHNPEKNRKPFVFLMFSGGVAVQHWTEMGWRNSCETQL